jgi:hypothetical protein
MVGAKIALDARLPDMPEWTLHDLRHTMATCKGELGVQPNGCRLRVQAALAPKVRSEGPRPFGRSPFS